MAGENGRRRRARGFTALELLAAIAIIGILITLVAVVAVDAVGRSQRERGRAQLATLQLAVRAYYSECRAYPPEMPSLYYWLQGDGRHASGRRPLTKASRSEVGGAAGDEAEYLDPWGQPIIYQRAGSPMAVPPFEIISRGPDRLWAGDAAVAAGQEEAVDADNLTTGSLTP